MRKGFRLKKVGIIAAVLLLMASVFSPFREALYATDSSTRSYTKEELIEISKGIVAWKNKAAGLSESADLLAEVLSMDAASTSSDWYVIALSKLGLPGNYQKYLSALTDVVVQKYTAAEKLSASKATEWHRIALAVLACGGNPQAVGGNINLIADGTYNRGLVKPLNNQGNNGMVFALIAMDSMNYEVPSDAYESRLDILQSLLDSQLSDGGFAQWGSSSDVDVSAMAIAALAPYRSKYEQPIERALSFLSSKQSASGGFSSGGVENAESAAQVIIALTSLGINPQTDARFIKNGYTPVNHLVSYIKESGGVCHTLGNPENDMASQQALCAMAALVAQMNGQNSLYRFVGGVPSLELGASEIENFSDSNNEILDPSQEEVVESTADDSANQEDSENMSLDDQKSSASNTSTHTTGLIMLALSAICILLALKIFKGRKRDVLVLIALGLAVAAFYVLANPQSTEKHYEKDNVENAYGEVSLRIDCSVVFDHWEELDETLKDGDYWPKDGIILERSEYSIEEGDTAFDVLLDAVTQNKIHIDYQGGDANIYNTVYIEGIQYLYEFSCGKLSGWTYAVNGSFPDVGCSSYVLSDGDFVEWMYTYDLGRDVGNLFEGEGE